MDLEFLTDPAAFLDVAGDRLAATPVVATVVATVAARAVAEIADGVPQDARHWYVVARDGGVVVGVGMRTAPHGDRPAYLLPMPDEAARLLARAVHDRGEDLTAVNGALPAVQVFADELGRLTGRTPQVGAHTRLHELGELVEPRPVPGALRPAARDDLDRGHPHPVATPPGRGRARRLPGPGAVGVRAGTLGRAVPGGGRAARRRGRSLRPAQPPARARGLARLARLRVPRALAHASPTEPRRPRIRCGRTGVVIAWKCPCFGLVSLT